MKAGCAITTPANRQDMSAGGDHTITLRTPT